MRKYAECLVSSLTPVRAGVVVDQPDPYSKQGLPPIGQPKLCRLRSENSMSDDKSIRAVTFARLRGVVSSTRARDFHVYSDRDLVFSVRALRESWAESAKTPSELWLKVSNRVRLNRVALKTSNL